MEQKVKGDSRPQGSWIVRSFFAQYHCMFWNRFGTKAANTERENSVVTETKAQKAIRQSPVSKTDSVRHTCDTTLSSFSSSDSTTTSVSFSFNY